MYDLPLNVSPQPGEILARRYRIVRPIAAGGFGELYLAEQIALGRRVAIKVLHPELTLDDTTVERFQREARIACQVQHPNLVVYHDFGADEDGRFFLVMEYLAGRSLADVLDGTPAIPLGRTLHIVGQVCAALQAAHDAGIIHRDLKPGNVMLVERAGDPDFVKVIDFGILKQLDGRPGTRDRDSGTRNGAWRDVGALTRPDEILGTPEYLAPELVRGDPFDGRADQYAAGVLLYEMIVGQRPFGGPTALEVLEAQVRDDPAPLVDGAAGRALPPTLEGVIRRALAKRPDRRYASMSEFGAALRSVGRPYADGEQAAPTRRPDEEAPGGGAAGAGGEDSTLIDFLVDEGARSATTPVALPPVALPTPAFAAAPASAAPSPRPARRRTLLLAAAAAVVAAAGGIIAVLTA